ncbi:hypothetical protein ACFE04_013058 [Oxalis oulophora]
MGGLCSTAFRIEKASATANIYAYASGHDAAINKFESNAPQQTVLTTPHDREIMQKNSEDQNVTLRDVVLLPDDFYDGIPQYDNDTGMQHKSRSIRSTHAAVAKVSEVSSRLGRASMGKAKDVFDTLGSSMTNLNPSSGFSSGVATKGNELAILAFEVANTIVKAYNLMHSLSKERIRHVKDVVLVSKGVQNLVSEDMGEVLRIVAADKREELSVFSGEVVRFGNRCKDPQWHNLGRYFDNIGKELIPQDSLKEEAKVVIEQFMILARHTAELYHELQVLDRFEQDYQRKHHEDDKGNSLTILKEELKSQRKHVKILKKKSFWSRSLEEIMENLVDIVHFLSLEIHDAFGRDNGQLPAKGSVCKHQRLGPCGLSLHYANVVMQIDSIVARSSSVPMSTRDSLYQSLPPGIKSALHSKLQSFHVKEELTVTQVKAEMEKTLHWLVPVASNTAKAHHGFGWVGEWANTGSDSNRKSASGPMDVIRIETFYHADKGKTEAYILEQVLWLHYLVSRSMAVVEQNFKSHIRSQSCVTFQKLKQDPKLDSCKAPPLSTEDQLLLQNASMKNHTLGPSRSLDFDLQKNRFRKHDKLSKSTSHCHSPAYLSEGTSNAKRQPSGVPLFGLVIENQKTLDIIDRLDALVR